jgi:hypothetical protein
MAGLVGSTPVPDITTVLGFVALFCGVVLTSPENGIKYLIRKGANPDQKVLVAEPTTNATPRQIVQKNCPALLNALSGG